MSTAPNPTAPADFQQLLEKLDLQDIERLRHAKRALALLEQRRQAHLQEIALIEDRIAQVRAGTLDPKRVLASAPADREKKPEKAPGYRQGGLTATLVEVLQERGAPMTVADLVEAVRAMGIKSDSKSFVQQVRSTLSTCVLLENVGRGTYRLKPGAPALASSPSPGVDNGTSG